MASQGQRRDSKHRILHTGESIRANGKYQYKYMVNGKPKFIYSWRLVSTDPQPVGKQPCLSLRELEKMVGQDLVFISSKLYRLIVIPRQEFIQHMFGKLLFFFHHSKIAISYKLKKSLQDIPQTSIKRSYLCVLTS